MKARTLDRANVNKYVRPTIVSYIPHPQGARPRL
jgi:hypothetical protein